jgi:type I restriction enzyme S subunit
VVSEGNNIELGAITHWLSGGTPSRSVKHYWSGDIPWISASTLKKFEVSESDQCVTAEAVTAGSKMAPINSTLLLVRGSALHNEIRAGVVCKPVCFNQDVKALIPSKDVYPKYLTYSILGSANELLKLVSSAGNTAGVLDTKLVQSFQVWLPGPEEQYAIATALVDVDALLEELDRLIAKRRDIKQAAMQQLLTGETRLPGFEGKWKNFRLGDHVTFLKNGTNSRAELISDGSIRYLHYGDIHASSASFLSPYALPFLPNDKATTLSRLEKGDLVLSDSSEDVKGIGKSVEIVDTDTSEVVAGLHTIAARFNKDVLADGFKAYLRFCNTFITPLRRLAAGTKVYATTRKHISSIEMQLPEVEEQIAISRLLQDMDAEIQVLEQRRSKTAELKQGMMQDLLTGRTRLV